ncbi:MAG: aminopeptidase [Phycisphaeraceae bacterium]|nr:aminopeptidase [Phycisphaeraceae bacterium]
MRDQRLDKLADVLVNYSVKVQPGQLIRINGDQVGADLLEAIYEAVLKAGGHPLLRCGVESCQDIFLQCADEDQLQYVNPVNVAEVEHIDASIGLWADNNTKSATRVDPKRSGLASSARKPIFETFMKRAAAAEFPDQYPGVKPLKWVGTLYPTQASAQDAERSLREYEDFVFKAGYLDHDNPAEIWEQIREKQQRVVDYLNGKSLIHFQTTSGTDLTVNVDGMTWINCAGESNFPDGEVFTGPNLKHADGGVNGVVKYTFPAVHNGREVHDIELTFEAGRVVDAKASKGLDFLIAMLDQDEGARSLGEIAVGTNYQVTEYTKNTLFDEKIGGTFHAAVGAGYPETGNDNQSGLHWDMVCDLRTGGTITVDGEVISRDGKFVFDGWPGN